MLGRRPILLSRQSNISTAMQPRTIQGLVKLAASMAGSFMVVKGLPIVGEINKTPKESQSSLALEERGVCCLLNPTKQDGEWSKRKNRDFKTRATLADD